ncbi:MAG: winged helix-turn-helix domain-containing protein [Candidatus Rokubacteria bacterium]|nr:winged helix-turn-helix domain-containing protein [Candidatus Rokubacteria bacterium]
MLTTSRGSPRDFAALEARRFRAAQLFARGESQAAVARILGVTTAAVNHWHQAWQANGRAGLKAAGRAGRKPRLERKQLALVERSLRAGPRAQGFSTDLWTLPRVAALIERVTGVRHHPGHVWRLLRGLGWSLQRPARRARERDEAAIEQWKTRRWAQLKKTPGTAARGSSSRTKAASPSTRSSAAPGPHVARRRS